MKERKKRTLSDETFQIYIDKKIPNKSSRTVEEIKPNAKQRIGTEAKEQNSDNLELGTANEIPNSVFKLNNFNYTVFQMNLFIKEQCLFLVLIFAVRLHSFYFALNLIFLSSALPPSIMGLCFISIVCVCRWWRSWDVVRMWGVTWEVRGVGWE